MATSTRTAQPVAQVSFSSTSWGVMLHRDPSGQQWLTIRPTTTNLMTVAGFIGLCLLALALSLLNQHRRQRRSSRSVLPLVLLNELIPEEAVEHSDDSLIAPPIVSDPLDPHDPLDLPTRPKIRRISL